MEPSKLRDTVLCVPLALTLFSCILVHTTAELTSLPVAMDPVVIGGNVDACPSTQDRESARVNISSSVRNLLQNVVVPVLQLDGALAPQCGDGIWRQVAFLNMSDPSQQCPQTWREYSSPARACGRHRTTSPSCPSAVFSTGDSQYSKVCGRAIGYRVGSPDQFRSRGRITSVDQNYVDGISVTYGSNPRNHIWTFTAGHNNRFDCPCSTTTSAQIQPSFVGNNYFCEPESNSGDPLWDGRTCSTSLCCSFNSPPWFSVTLPSTTSEDIELRICGNEGSHVNEDTPVALLEIYVQ